MEQQQQVHEGGWNQWLAILVIHSFIIIAAVVALSPHGMCDRYVNDTIGYNDSN